MSAGSRAQHLATTRTADMSRTDQWHGSTVLRTPLLAYVTARLTNLAVLFLFPSTIPVRERVLAFDAGYYAGIAEHGYPRAVEHGSNIHGSRIGFFPGYPLVVHVAHEVTHLPVWGAALLVSVICGALATVVIALVATRHLGLSDGPRAATIWAVAPQSFLFVVGYSEGLFVALAALSLLWMLGGRRTAAGVAAAGASLTRPTGVALALVALVEVFRRRSFRPTAVLAGAGLGAGAYVGWIGFRTHRWDAWPYVERHFWHTHEDLGVTTVKLVASTVLHPAEHLLFDAVTLFVAALAVLLVALARLPVPLALTVYAVAVLAFAVTSGTGVLSSMPRLAYTAFPILFPLSRFLGRRPLVLRVALGVLSVACSAVLVSVVTTTHAYTP